MYKKRKTTKHWHIRNPPSDSLQENTFLRVCPRGCQRELTSWSKPTNTQIKALFSAWDHVCVCVFACFLSYFDFLFTTFCSSSLKKKKKKFWTTSSRLFQQLPQITVIIFVKTSSFEKRFKSKSKENIKPNLNVKNEVGFSDPVIQYQRHQ